MHREKYFNPLGRKTETVFKTVFLCAITISIHSVARPRLQVIDLGVTHHCISIHSVARPRLVVDLLAMPANNFNPLGRKTETIAEWISQKNREISIHSVARPRPPFKLLL